MVEAVGILQQGAPPPEVGWGGLMSERWTNPIVVLVPPPIAQEEVNKDNNRLREIVDKTRRQKWMKVGGTGRKGKGRR